MQTDFSVLSGHLEQACRLRKIDHDPICAAAVDLHFAGVRALDIYRLAKIADELNVSVDWLLGRTDIMELPKANMNVPIS
jgi:orotate phosphoribosyltransferase-like protein